MAGKIISIALILALAGVTLAGFVYDNRGANWEGTCKAGTH